MAVAIRVKTPPAQIHDHLQTGVTRTIEVDAGCWSASFTRSFVARFDLPPATARSTAEFMLWAPPL
jgi:hypothetical protein